MKQIFACHYSEVRTGKESDTFVVDFAKHMTTDDPHAKDVHEICKFNILWEGNPTNLSKTFGTRNFLFAFKRS